MKCYSHESSEALGTCTACGRAICRDCQREVSGMLRCPAHDVVASAMPPISPQTVPAAGSPVEPRRKSPGLAFFLGMFPGMGHIYLGLYQRAAMVFGAWAFMIFLSDRGSSFFGLCVAFMFFFSIFDALRLAKMINRGGMEEDPADLIAGRMKSGQGKLVLGVVLMILGTLFWIDEKWGFDWSILANNFYVVMLAIGGILIFQAVRSRRASVDADGTSGGAGKSSGTLLA